MSNNQQQPDISVLLITYNHEEYIEESLQSIISQKGNFTYEIVVAEDCSTDGTRDKIVNFLSKRDIPYKLLFREQNVGIPKNFADGVLNCSGSFIVPMSGDDLFLNACVIDHLLNFMRVNKSVVLYSTNAVHWFVDRGLLKIALMSAEVKRITTVDLLRENPIGGGIIFRNIIKKFPEVYFRGDAEDRQMWWMLSEFGDIVVNPMVVGRIYRRHGRSFTMSDSRNRMEKYDYRIKNKIEWRPYLSWVKDKDFYQALNYHRRKKLRLLIKQFRLIEAFKTYVEIKKCN